MLFDERQFGAYNRADFGTVLFVKDDVQSIRYIQVSTQTKVARGKLSLLNNATLHPLDMNLYFTARAEQKHKYNPTNKCKQQVINQKERQYH